VDADPGVLAHLERRAVEGVYRDHNYRGADQDADALLALLALGPGSEPTESEMVAAKTAHTIKAVILRDRSSPAAEHHFDAAEALAATLNHVDDLPQLRSARVTGQLNRGAIDLAGQEVLQMLTSSSSHPSLSVLRRAGRLLEIVGRHDTALSLLEGAPFQDRSDPEHWPDQVQIARLQSALGRAQGGYRGRQLRHSALGRLEAAEPAVRRSGQQVFRLGAIAARGLVLLDANDRPGAIDAADEAVALCETMGIRNRWTESLVVRLGGHVTEGHDPLATMWARYWRHRLSDPRLAFAELGRGWETLLGRAVELDGTRPPRGGLPALYRTAREVLRANGVGDLADVLPEDVADKKVRVARNAVAHEIVSETDFAHECVILEPAVRKLEELLDGYRDLTLPRRMIH
jgi:tetratricopeptide (TPR) repeat protein